MKICHVPDANAKAVLLARRNFARLSHEADGMRYPSFPGGLPKEHSSCERLIRRPEELLDPRCPDCHGLHRTARIALERVHDDAGVAHTYISRVAEGEHSESPVAVKARAMLWELEMIISHTSPESLDLWKEAS